MVIAPIPLAAIALSSLLCAWGARRDLRLPAWASLAVALVVSAAVWATFGAAFAPLALLVLTCALIIETDRRHHLIPDALTLSILVLSFAMPFAETPTTHAIGAAALGGTFLLVRQACGAWRGAEALGWGDVKLAAAMGALLGPVHAFAAVAVAGAATLLIVAAKPREGAVAIGAPFGIGLASATAIVALLRAVTP